jgi:hypothetical protein
MNSGTFGEVERLLQTEMADLEKFYKEFGEGATEGEKEVPVYVDQREEVGLLRAEPTQMSERVIDPLRNSTKFMKSGDFFDYIENIVEEDLHKNEAQVGSFREVESVPVENIDRKAALKNLNINMSHARNLEVQMKEQSTFLEHVHSEKGGGMREYRQEEASHMMDIQEEEEVLGDPEMEEPEVKTRYAEDVTWRRNENMNQSMDERVISTKKKTFEEMLEEALKKEGQPVQEINEQAPVVSTSQIRKSNFLKKNTSRRRFLNKKKKVKSRYGRPNFKKKKKVEVKTEMKDMTESMLEFEQMEQRNGNNSDEIENAASIKEESENEEEEIDYKFLKMEEEGIEEEKGEETEGGGPSSAQLKVEVAKIKKQVEAKFKKKIDELNREIGKYKKRNKTLEEDKKRITKMKKKIEEDKAQVDRLKAEKQDFENYKQKEMEKLKREKALTKRNAKAYRANTNKKDKETITNLKKELRVAREQAQNKERKLKDALDRRKRTIEELKNENEELRGQVDFYEKMRMNERKGKSRQKAEKHEVEEESEEEEDEESGEEEDEEEEEDSVESVHEKPTRNVRSLKAAVERLGKKKGKKENEVKKFLTDFYSEFENPIPNVDKGTLKINNENYKYDENTHFKKYKWNRETDLEVVQEEESEGKIYKTFSDGRKEIKFSNGAVKEIMPDGYIIGRDSVRSFT